MDIVGLFEEAVKEHHLEDEVVLSGSFCIGKCNLVGVTVQVDYQGELPVMRTYQEISETIASPRLDAVVKALLRISREEAARQIRAGSVSLDHRPIEDVAATVPAPSTVSIRGCGRFIIDRIGPPTKKGRLLLQARKCV